MNREAVATLEGSSFRRWVWPFLTMVLGGLFLLAGFPKILAPEEFAVAISRLGLLPEGSVAALAILLPWVEVTAGLALLFLPKWREASLMVLMTLLVLFTGALLLGLLRGNAAPCGCFGGWLGFLGHPVVAVIRNFLLLFLATCLYVRAYSGR